MNEAQDKSETPDVKVRPRDKKGHFLPSGRYDGKPPKEVSPEAKEDPNVVKIKVVREQKPKPPKNIVGKLNDMKERYASRFITSVIENNPPKLDIDGHKYYSDKYIKQLKLRVFDAETNEAEAIECMKDLKKNTETLLDCSKKLLADNGSLRISRLAWRTFALGLVAGGLLALTVAGAISYVNCIEKDPQKAALTPSATR